MIGVPVNSERDNWENITPEDATAEELYVIHQIMGGRPEWLDTAQYRINMQACVRYMREYASEYKK